MLSYYDALVESANLGIDNRHAHTRNELAELLKGLTVTVTGFRPIAEAIVTSGGVEVSSIDPKAMESKLVSGLYFAGEVIDADAYTGGYNLQIAFSTGRLAGISAAQSISDQTGG